MDGGADFENVINVFEKNNSDSLAFVYLFLIFLFLLFFLFLIRVAPAGLEKGQSLFQVPIGMGPPCNSNNFYKTYTVSISPYKSTSNKLTTPLGDVASIKA